MLSKIVRTVKAGLASAITEWQRQTMIDEAKQLEAANFQRAKSGQELGDKTRPVKFNFASAASGYEWRIVNGVQQMVIA